MEELARLSLNHPVRVFVDGNTDMASNLRQEFVRVKAKKEKDREAIITGIIYKFLPHASIIIYISCLFIMTGHVNTLYVTEQQPSLGGRNVALVKRLAFLKKIISSCFFLVWVAISLLQVSFANRRKGKENAKGDCKTSQRAELSRQVRQTRVNIVIPPGKMSICVYELNYLIIITEVIVKYKDKIHALETEIKAVLKQEEEEKHTRLSEMAISKARNIVQRYLVVRQGRGYRERPRSEQDRKCHTPQVREQKEKKSRKRGRNQKRLVRESGINSIPHDFVLCVCIAREESGFEG